MTAHHVPMPSDAEFAASLAAARRRPAPCGCHAALVRDPFAPALVSHWTRHHPGEGAILQRVQAGRRADPA